MTRSVAWNYFYYGVGCFVLKWFICGFSGERFLLLCYVSGCLFVCLFVQDRWPLTVEHDWHTLRSNYLKKQKRLCCSKRGMRLPPHKSKSRNISTTNWSKVTLSVWCKTAKKEVKLKVPINGKRHKWYDTWSGSLKWIFRIETVLACNLWF